jgi:long-chain acyl-CoA synthetase
MLMFTGGTTGRPKAALSSHHGLFTTGSQIRAWMASVIDEWQDVNLLLMPLFHTYGNVGVLSAALVAHHVMVPVPNPRDLNDVLDTIEKERPAFVAGVPTLFIALLNHPRIQQSQVDLRSIKLCLSGASALMVETKQRFEQLTGGRIIEGYGLTEGVLALVLNPVEGTFKPGSVGMPVPDVSVRVVDGDEGTRDLPLGEVGEIIIGAPQLMLGYWQRPEATAAMVRDGWLYTGDLGYMDEDGYVFIIDRKKDLIKPSGFQVWPREVEEVIAAHPAVSEVGVAGVPDPVQVEAVKAWIVLKPDAILTKEELRAYCKEHLAGYKVPRQVAFCDTLPKSSVGKVLRRELKALDDRESGRAPAGPAS